MTQATCYRLVIPNWWPHRQNQAEGHHWGARYRLKRVDRNLLAGYSLGIPRAKVKRSVRLIITLGPRQRGADPDAFWKGLLDSLVSLGMLVDDSRKWCLPLPVEYLRGTQRATTIELTDL